MTRSSSQNPAMARAVRRGSHAACGSSGSSRIMASSSSGRRRSAGELGRSDKGLHLCDVLAAAVRPIGPGLRIDTGWPNGGDRGGDIVGTEPAGENDRDPELVDDATA